MARFPRSPGVGDRPFQDGPNPFSDRDASEAEGPIPQSDNPLRGPTTADAAVQPYNPTDYQQTLPDRSSRTLTVGLIGFGLIMLSVLIMLFVFAGGSIFFR